MRNKLFLTEIERWFKYKKIISSLVGVSELFRNSYEEGGKQAL